MNGSFTYVIGDKLYINLTNRCSNACSFCIRSGRQGMEGETLWLTEEPSAADVIALLGSAENYSEAVFCGFGEPTYKLAEIAEIGAFLKAKGVRVRLNTNGHASLIHGSRAVEVIAAAVDVVSISLNAPTAEKYQAVCFSEFGDEGFYGMLRFAADIAAAGVKTVLTVVDTIPREDIEECRKLVESEVPGAEFRVRNYDGG